MTFPLRDANYTICFNEENKSGESVDIKASICSWMITVHTDNLNLKLRKTFQLTPGKTYRFQVEAKLVSDGKILRYPGRSIFRPVLKISTRYIDVKFCAESSGELRFSIRQSSTTPPLEGTF